MGWARPENLRLKTGRAGTGPIPNGPGEAGSGGAGPGRAAIERPAIYLCTDSSRTYQIQNTYQ